MTEVDRLPEAVVTRGHRFSFAWLLPLLALALVVYMSLQAWNRRGVSVTVKFEQGHGIKTGDTVRYRGIQVGEVADVQLDAFQEHVVLELHVGHLLSLIHI